MNTIILGGQRKNAKISILPGVLLLLLICLGLFIGIAACGGIGDGSGILIENSSLKYIIGKDGKNKAFIDKATGKDYLDKSESRSFMSISKDGTIYGASSIEQFGDTLKVRFETIDATATVKMQTRDNYCTFELIDLDKKDIDKITLAELSISITDSVGSLVSVTRNKDFAACLMGLNMETNTTAGASGASTVLSAYSEPSVGLIGIKCALIGVPTPLFLPLVDVIEQENKLPRQTFEGKWGRTSPEIRESYLFIDFTEKNIDKVIAYAQMGGYKYVMAYRGTWSKSDGHYEINTKYFPSGIKGLKSTIKKIHDAGLKAGLHMLFGGINKNDAYVSPIPDPRIRKDGNYLLAADIDPTSSVVSITTSPEKHFTRPRFAGGGIDIQIDDEIITYNELSTSPPYSFSQCERGVHGTKASSHKKGAKVYHLAEIWGLYSVDVKNSILDEVAQHVADIVNDCEVDMVYFDGSEYASEQDVPDWYATSLCKYAYFSKWNRDVIVQIAAFISPFAWHFDSRMCSGDWACVARKTFSDKHRLRRAYNNYSMNYIPTDFGWWGLFTHTSYCEATYPDELEYIIGKAVARGSAFSLETNVVMMDRYGRMDELLEITNNYITAMKEKRFSSTMIRRLAELGKEFKLKKDDDSAWKLHPIIYGPEKIVKIEKETVFDFENTLSDQPIKLRLKTMTGIAEYGDPENIVLEDFDDVGKYTAEIIPRTGGVARTHVISSLTSSQEQTHNGQTSGKFEADSFKEGAPNQWCTQKLYGSVNYNILDHRTLGLWVFGDESGNLLDVQLFDKGGYSYRSHYVDLNFEGWKYIDFQKPEDTRALDYNWPYGGYHGLREFNYESVSDIGFSYLVNKMPEGGKIVTYLSRLEAIKEYPAKLLNPAITVNGKTITFPVTLLHDHYLEYWGEGTFKVYDTDARMIAEGTPQGEIPILRHGNNSVVINSRFECERIPRAKITIITMGDPVRE